MIQKTLKTKGFQLFSASLEDICFSRLLFAFSGTVSGSIPYQKTHFSASI